MNSMCSLSTGVFLKIVLVSHLLNKIQSPPLQLMGSMNQENTQVSFRVHFVRQGSFLWDLCNLSPYMTWEKETQMLALIPFLEAKVTLVQEKLWALQRYV